MAGWHHRVDGCEFEWTLGDGDGQGGLACCDSWGCKELDTTERLNWTDIYIHTHVSSANRDNFNPSFPIWMLFISFSCLITLARTSNTIVNSTGENGCPCFVLDLREKVFSFSLLSIVLALDMSYSLYYVEICFFLYPICWEFASWKNNEFHLMLFLHCWDDHDFYFILLMWCSPFIDLYSWSILGSQW